MQSLAKSIDVVALSSNVKVVSIIYVTSYTMKITDYANKKNLSFHAFWQKKTLQSIQMCYAATRITATTASNNGLIRFFWQWQPLLQLSPHSSFYKMEIEKNAVPTMNWTKTNKTLKTELHLNIYYFGSTVKLGDKERFDKEPFPMTNFQCTSQG